MSCLARFAANGLGLLQQSLPRKHRRRKDLRSPLRGESLEQRLPLAVDLGGHAVFAPGTSAAYMEQFHTEEFNLGPGGTGDGSGFAERWTRTATDGAGLGQGDPTVVTWSVVRDGGAISGGTSDLVSFLSNIYGQTDSDNDFTDEPWFGALQAGFDRWSELSGLELVYEAVDDGVASSGVLGVRGDIRVGGRLLDGDFGTLGFNGFPNGGDMVLDTGDSYFSNTGSNSLRLRNVVGHELGHGLGFSHVESSDAAFLMEPSIRLSFEGPQFDDLLAVQRAYGDIYEENGGNNSTQTATNIGSISHAATLSVGTSAQDSTTQVDFVDVDFVGIDDDSDLDTFGFSVPLRSQVTLTLSPKGPTYSEGLQGGSQSTFNAKSLSDLQLELIDADGSTVLQSADANGIGQNEIISSVPLPTAGTYFARVSGGQNQVQMYRLDISVEETPAVNSDPVARNDSASTTAGSPVAINVLANDTDADGDPLSVQSVTQGTNGSTSITANGTVRYVPEAGFSGNDSFTYVVSDGVGGNDSAAVTVTVNPLNNPPIARSDTVVSDEDTAVSMDVLSNDTDDDGDTLTVQSVSQGTRGTVTINLNGTVRYTPNANFNGSDSFTYVASDGNGATDSATVSVTIDPVNDRPVADADSAVTSEDTAVAIAVLDNDTDVDTDTLSVQSVTQGSDGQVTVTANGAVRYTPNANFHGSDSFTYIVQDGNGGTDSATVVVTVNSVNDRPQARDDSGATREETAVSIAVLSNDTDADGDALSVQSVTQGSAGTVTIAANGTISYTPNAGFSGTDSFQYAIADGRGGTDTATVSIRVDALDRDDIVALADDTLHVARSTGDAFVTNSVGSTGVKWTDVRRGDVNGDAIDDLIGRNGDTLWVARSTGQTFDIEAWGLWSSRITWSFFDLADVDGDGATDVVGRTQAGDWWVGKSSGTNFVNQKWGAWSPRVRWQDVKVADVNGDGRSDVVGRANGRWWVGVSDGTSFVNERWGAWSKRALWQHVQIADVDGDGTDDIIGITRGQWWIARSNGTSFVNERWGSWSRKVDWVDVRVGDFDGDGLADVAGRGDGRWWVARSTGSSFVNEQWGRWSTAVAWVDVIVGDFDGDGRDDIAGRTGGRWWVAQSTGDGFANELWERWSVFEPWTNVMAGEFVV